MRKALAILAAAATVLVGPPACDSCAVRNKSARSQPDLSPYDIVQRQHRRSMGKFRPQDEPHEIDWQRPRRGDFWTPTDYKRAFPR
jgi:hypothetical protein